MRISVGDQHSFWSIREDFLYLKHSSLLRSSSFPLLFLLWFFIVIQLISSRIHLFQRCLWCKTRSKWGQNFPVLESGKDIKGTKAMKLRLQAQQWCVLWQTIDNGRICNSTQQCKIGCLRDRVNFSAVFEVLSWKCHCDIKKGQCVISDRSTIYFKSVLRYIFLRF